MKPTTRRVAVYFAAGLLLAAAVGVAVWAGSSTGQSNRAGFTAQAAGGNGATVASTSAQEPTSETTSASATREREDRSRSADANAGQSANTEASQEANATDMPAAAGGNAAANYTVEDDPYLPPHAVIGKQKTEQQATNVYRPTNVVPQPAAGSEPSVASSAKQAGNEETSANQSATSESAGTSPRETTGAGDTQPAESPKASETPRSEQPDNADPKGTQNGETDTTEKGQDRQPAPAEPTEPAPSEARSHHVPGKENVAGYPKEQAPDAAAREIVDRFVNRVTK